MVSYRVFNIARRGAWAVPLARALVAGGLRVLYEPELITSKDRAAVALLDAWCLRHRGEAFDRDGAFGVERSLESVAGRAEQAEGPRGPPY